MVTENESIGIKLPPVKGSTAAKTDQETVNYVPDMFNLDDMVHDHTNVPFLHACQNKQLFLYASIRYFRGSLVVKVPDLVDGLCVMTTIPSCHYDVESITSLKTLPLAWRGNLERGVSSAFNASFDHGSK
ncbi:hypothetical protein TNCV_4308161 [Trichonephila clavipes]|nr:hypothetical protein TNCV_4308161 [Trichonephila clavipes]